MAKRALYQKNTRLGNTTQSLDGIIGSARGVIDGDNIPIQLGDRAFIIEDEVEYVYRYINYTGVADDDIYIRPFTDPDSSKAWFLINDPGLEGLYSDKIYYKIHARCIGSDGYRYKAYIANGPGNIVNPVGDITGTWILDEPIGVLQTWQSLIGSRAIGVTYTNTTGRTIVLNVSIIGSGAFDPGRYLITVNGIGTCSFGTDTENASVPIYGSSVIPNGATYNVSVSIGAGIAFSWHELR